MEMKYSGPLISVLIPSYNHEQYVREAIESVWAQSYQNIEIVVVDDASTDGSIAILKSLCESSPVPMRLVSNEQNRGPAFTIARAFELSQGELIAFLASDDVYAPSRFEVQVRSFAENPELLLVYGNGTVLNSGNAVSVQLHGDNVRWLLRQPPKEILTYLYTHVNQFYIQCALVKRSLLLNSNAFDPNALADDWVINIKMFEYLTHEGQCLFIDQVVCYYRLHAENLHKNSKRHIALLKQTIERYTPSNLKHIARANIYWEFGMFLVKTKPLMSIKYFTMSQLNQFRPKLLIDLLAKTLSYFWVKLIAISGLHNTYLRLLNPLAKKILKNLPVRIECLVQSLRARGKLKVARGSYIHPSVHLLGKNNIKIGENSCLSEGSWLNVNHIKSQSEISIAIGNNCYIGKNNFFTSGDEILIGDYTLTSIGCKFIGSTHKVCNPEMPYISTGTTAKDKIKVGVNCFLGAGVTVLGNVKIGHGSVIGAEALVLHDMPPFSMAVGNPAKVIKRYSFAQKSWLPASDISAEDEAAMPNEQDYLKDLNAKFPYVNMPWIASGKSMGDL